MKARITQRPKNAMQSGHSRTGQWQLELERAQAQRADPLMGWAGSGDTAQQVQLSFPSKDAAIAYATANGLEYSVSALPAHALKLQTYADNFR